jgi:hypothetical protein
MRVSMIATLVAVLALSATARDADAGARRGRPLKTGQTTCWNVAGQTVSCAGTGEDGELQRGEPRAYEDLGDGTVRDKRTALTWEKMSDDGSIHDKDAGFTWAQAFDKIDALNTPPCFGGFCDWRLPTPHELYTLVNLGFANPSVSQAFNTGCTPGCTVLTCSCTGSSSYWTSTSQVNDPDSAYLVALFNGGISIGAKTLTNFRARAVRGGS